MRHIQIEPNGGCGNTFRDVPNCARVDVGISVRRSIDVGLHWEVANRKLAIGLAQSDRRAWARHLTFLLLMVFAGAIADGSSSAATKNPAQLKAIWLYKFLSYADWPASKMPPDGDFVLGVVGDEQVAALLKPVEAKKVKQHSIRLVQYADAQEAILKGGACHILFIGQSQNSKVDGILKALQKSGVLTVGEGAAFQQSGGGITLMFNERPPLAISDQTLEGEGITLDSKLRELAR
jgi:hypothetical protein